MAFRNPNGQAPELPTNPLTQRPPILGVFQKTTREGAICAMRPQSNTASFYRNTAESARKVRNEASFTDSPPQDLSPPFGPFFAPVRLHPSTVGP